MASETIITKGSFVEIITSAAVANGVMSAQSDSILTALDATDEVLALLDFKLDITAGTAPTLNTTFNLYRRPSDGTDTAPAPSTTYLQQFVRSFTVANANGKYFVRDVPNSDNNDTFYVLNKGGQTSTFTLDVRGKSYGIA